MENLKSKTAWTLAILGVILVALISSTTAYYVGSSRNEDVKKDLQSQIDSMKAEVASIKNDAVAVATPTPTPIVSASPTATATPSATASWNSYSNSTYSFSMKYPSKNSDVNYLKSANPSEVWTANESTPDGYLLYTSFGPSSSKSGGYVWGVTVLDGSITNVGKLISDQGSQFTDRKEAKKTITINGVNATLVTVTTTSIPSWISKVVYIENAGKIFKISNGAVDSSEFELFYNSFQIVK